MNNLITVVAITIVSLLLASPFFLQTQNAYIIDIYVQGYVVGGIRFRLSYRTGRRGNERGRRG